MISSISIFSDNKKVDCLFKDDQSNKIVIDLIETRQNKTNNFYIEIIFREPIISFRNHDYTWIKPNNNCIATEFSPKIIQLGNGSYIQPNTLVGIWEINKKSPNSLLWRFNPYNSKPLTSYIGNKNQKSIFLK